VPKRWFNIDYFPDYGVPIIDMVATFLLYNLPKIFLKFSKQN